MHNLGFITDCIFHQRLGVVEDRGEYIAIKTPSNPGYYWGNYLFFPDAPTPGNFDTWMTYYKREFGKETGHVSFAWNGETRGELSDFLSAGFEWDEQVVLRLQGPKWDVRRNLEVETRPIISQADWQAVVELQIQMSDQELTPGFIEFKEKAMQGMRHLQENGQGSWWGAFLNSKLVGSMGLFFDFEKRMGRFQSVETHPEHQNQGICKTLMKAVMLDAIEKKGITDLVIVTEPENHARKIYHAFGFADHSKQCGICLPRPYWEAHA